MMLTSPNIQDVEDILDKTVAYFPHRANTISDILAEFKNTFPQSALVIRELAKFEQDQVALKAVRDNDLNQYVSIKALFQTNRSALVGVQCSEPIEVDDLIAELAAEKKVNIGAGDVHQVDLNARVFVLDCKTTKQAMAEKLKN